MSAGVLTLLRVTLSVEQPWAVGGAPAPGDTMDLPVQRDPRRPGEMHLPASTLTGALREHLGEHAEHLLGPGLGRREVRPGTPAAPSPVRVLGTVVTGAVLTSNASTAVDRARRAARPGTLRTEQRVEGDQGGATTVHWHLERAGRRDDELMDALMDALTSWAPVIGRRRSSGQGQALVRKIDWVEADLATDAGLTWWLSSRGAWFDGGSRPDPTAGLSSGTVTGTASNPVAPVIDVKVVVVDPLHVGADKGSETRQAVGAAAPQGVRLGNHGKPVIPATSWKGLFRHRVEHVLESVGAPELDRKVVVAALFGASTAHAGRDADGRDTVTGGRGCLRFSESTLTGRSLVTRSHVAIDRISGGARDSLLFAWRSVPTDATAQLTIGTLRSLPEAVEVLLDHVLRDLHDGLIGVGGGTSRGYGTVRVDPPPTTRPAPLDLDAVTSWAQDAARTEESR